MSPLLIIQLIAQVGLPLATEIMKLFETKSEITSADMLALKVKYATMTWEDYVAEAQKGKLG